MAVHHSDRASRASDMRPLNGAREEVGREGLGVERVKIMPTSEVDAS